MPASIDQRIGELCQQRDADLMNEKGPRGHKKLAAFFAGRSTFNLWRI
jgi:hypothetical protein